MYAGACTDIACDSTHEICIPYRAFFTNREAIQNQSAKADFVGIAANSFDGNPNDANLPSTGAVLPSTGANLPSTWANLPSTGANLPSTGAVFDGKKDS
jgi:hypothetical protein